MMIEFSFVTLERSDLSNQLVVSVQCSMFPSPVLCSACVM